MKRGKQAGKLSELNPRGLRKKTHSHLSHLIKPAQTSKFLSLVLVSRKNQSLCNSATNFPTNEVGTSGGGPRPLQEFRAPQRRRTPLFAKSGGVMWGSEVRRACVSVLSFRRGMVMFRSRSTFFSGLLEDILGGEVRNQYFAKYKRKDGLGFAACLFQLKGSVHCPCLF